MTGNKFIINQSGEIEDTMTHITFDSFMEILIVLNGQSRQLKKLSEENEKLKKYNKGQELEIIRLHNLADTMSAVLRELGIYDVYNDEQIENVKKRIIND